MRYFAGFLVAIGLLILVFILILKGFSHSSGPKTPQITLSDYANTDTVVQLTIDGPLTSDQKHHGVRITVGQNQSTIQTYQGYQNDITSSKTYSNNESSYDNFLHALQLYGFTKGSTDPNKTDERGYCPNGNRYIYEILSDGGSDIERFWSTSCGGQGNFSGNPSEVRQLFIRQIPDYGTITAKLNI